MLVAVTILRLGRSKLAFAYGQLWKNEFILFRNAFWRGTFGRDRFSSREALS